MHRIYFDTNNSAEPGRYVLHVAGSVADIEPIADQLRDGLRVVIYMTGELELEATLEFDPTWNAWTAREVPGTLRYYDEAPDA